MRRRTWAARGLIECMIAIAWVQSASIAQIPSGSQPETVQLQAARWGTGAKVKIKLADGRALRGEIQEINDGGIVIGNSSGARTQVAYGQIAQMKLARLMYRAHGTPDPAAARRVIEVLGLGHHVVVSTIEGRELHGFIQVVDTDSFVMLPDHQPTSVEIAYDRVQYVEQNLNRASKIALVAVAAVAAAVIVFVISQRNKIGY